MADLDTRHPHASTTPASAAERVARTVWDWRSAGDEETAAAERSRAAAAARKGGVVRALIGFGIALLLAWWKPILGIVAGSLSALILLIALVSPLGAYAAIARGLERFGHGVGLVVTWVLMLGVFFLFFLPLGLFLRLTGKLGLRHGADSKLATYWQPVDWGAVEPETYRRQF